MASNIDRYTNDITRLVNEGGLLALAMQRQASPHLKPKTNVPDEQLKNLPDVHSKYQPWYSEALALVTQLLPERLDDFKSYYAPRNQRKEIDHGNYTMTDYLRGTTIRSRGTTIVDPSAALPAMYQQYNIVAGLLTRFESSLYDIRTLVHADLLDDELDVAETLNRNGYSRAGGAVAGVVLEGHLAAVCSRHAVTPKKKDPSIADLNDALKNASIIETSQWRFVQHLGDLRNKCDHKKQTEPSAQEVTELVEGVRKVTKTIL